VREAAKEGSKLKKEKHAATMVLSVVVLAADDFVLITP
jgi:hypothetical protein